MRAREEPCAPRNRVLPVEMDLQDNRHGIIDPARCNSLAKTQQVQLSEDGANMYLSPRGRCPGRQANRRELVPSREKKTAKTKPDKGEKSLPTYANKDWHPGGQTN